MIGVGPQIKVDSRLAQRLNGLKGAHWGCLYGLPAIPESTDYTYFAWTATGREKAEEEKIKGNQERKDLEVLSEILPCGIDPIGVFLTMDENETISERRIQTLVDQLPEPFLELCDPIALARESGGELQAFIFSEGQLVPTTFVEVDGQELTKNLCQIVRVKGHLTVVSPQTEGDLQNAFKNLIEKVSCPYGTFRLENSDVFFLHIWEGRLKSSGWASQEMFEEEVEQCYVTNIDDKTNTLKDLWRFVKDNDDEDDGFGVVKDKKKKIVEQNIMNFRLQMKMSHSACTSKTVNCAPIIYYENKNDKAVRIPIKIDALGVIRKTTKIPDMMEILKGCVQRQLHDIGRCVLSELKMKNSNSLPEVFHFTPEPLGHPLTIVYNKSGTCVKFAEFRKHLHKLFLLPLDRPYFRRMNAMIIEADQPKKGPLRNVHVGLKMGATGGEVHLVQGNYSYYHYMQDNFDDDGWGCAYRSLQTLISWFKYQGYTETKIPTHKEIQKCLVDIGDKDASFIGTKQWIGSTEVGFVLEKACEVQYKLLSVSSGDEMPSKGRELAHHFKTNGTPVMIGGGVLAHTILGVDWNESTGDIRWLILDPHFTGADWTQSGKPNVAFMQQKGWVGWKGPDFWVKGAFYNMCMPQRPKQW